MFFFRKPTMAGAFLTTLAGLTMLGNQAHADLQFNSSAVVGNLFSYDLNFNNSTDSFTGLPSQRLQSGNYATIYDIGGLNSATLNPIYASQFTLTTQVLGITPPGTLPTDGTLTNVTLTYKGLTVTADQSWANILQLNSSFTSVDPGGQYAGLTTKNSGAAAGTDVASIGSVAVPSGRNSNVTQTPEPGNLALFIGAGVSVAFLKHRRRRTRK